MLCFSGCIFYYRPQRSWGKVMFLHLSVILFTGEGGVWSPGQTPPGTDTPLGRHPPGQTLPCPWQTPPLGQTPHPGRQTHTPLSRPPPGRHPPGRHPPCTDTPGRHPPPPATTAADGMHPTGMHSCWCLKSSFILTVMGCVGLSFSLHMVRLWQQHEL